MKKFKSWVTTGAIVSAVALTSATVFAAYCPYIDQKKEILQQRVEIGDMTQERADEIIAAIEENAQICDGTGSARIGQNMGAGFGMGHGHGRGQGGCGRGVWFNR